MAKQAIQEGISSTAPKLAIAGPSATVSTSAGTLQITLTSKPPAPIDWYANPLLWVPFVTLLGVRWTIKAAERRSKAELEASENRLSKELQAKAAEAAIEREQTRDQARLDREHDAIQSHQERITKARREVYLELIHEMTKGQMWLTSLSTQNIEQIDTYAGVGGIIAATSKIALLGEMSTVEIARELLTSINLVLFKVIPDLIPINLMRSEKIENDLKLREANAEGERIDAELKELLSRNELSVRTASLRTQLREVRSDALRYANAANEAQQNFIRMQRKYNDSLIEDAVALAIKLDDLILAIRTELNLESSEERLRASMARMQSAARDGLQKFNVDLRGLNGEN
jgi:hypothetical protein